MNREVPNTDTNRRQLMQIISGLSDGVMLVEVDQRIAWANEAALAMHGATDLAQLGADARGYARRFNLRYRNHHALTADNYPIARVARGDVFADVLVEVTPADAPERSWVHRVRSMVLTDAHGDTAFFVLIMDDVTEWASAEQRFEKTFGANPAPAVICRLSDLRYIKVNQGFLEMTGYSRDQVIGRSVYELDVFEGAEKRELAVERLGQGETIAQMQAELKLPDGASKQVIVAGQPLDLQDEQCMLFSFVDMEPRRKAETALRQSEERFAKSFRLSPVPTLVCSAELQLLEINEAFLNVCGYASEELLGRTIEEIGLLDGQASATLFARLEKTTVVRGLDVKVHKKDGEQIDCEVAADTVVIQDKPCYLLVMMNITERKRSELELVAAIEEVMKDASWFSRTLIEKLANVKSINTPVPSASFSALTTRERDVLGLICQGLADKEIAGRLKLAPNTVRNYVATLYSKLNVHSRSEAIVWARERGLFANERKIKTPR